MREKLLIALLSVCCTLLVVNLIALWSDADRLVHGQDAGGATAAAGGSYILHTTATQQAPYAFVLETSRRHLTAYSAQNNGIKVIGTRAIEFDLGVSEFNKHFSVKDARRLGKKPRRGRKK